MHKHIREFGMYALGILTVVSFFLVLVYTFKIEIPQNNRDVVMIMIGVLCASYKDVTGYFYGGSKGSADKTELMKNMIESQPKP
jgi:hypothetical protein